MNTHITHDCMPAHGIRTSAVVHGRSLASCHRGTCASMHGGCTSAAGAGYAPGRMPKCRECMDAREQPGAAMPIRAAAEKGSVLIVSMLMLLVLTLIGITAMGTSTLEEKMAGNSRDQNLAFQSAETALRDAETFIESIASVAAFNNSNGLYTTSGAPNIFANTTWAGTVSRVSTGTIAGLNSQPRYIIEMVSVSGQANPSPEECYDCPEKQGQVTNLRITARGTGGTNDAVVMLQGYYGRMF